MMVKQHLFLGLLAALPLAASAQSMAQGAPHQRSPLDASAVVRAPAYVSAFKGYQAGSEEQAAPDKVWRHANEAVGKLGGHAGHVAGNADTAPAMQPASAGEPARTSSQMAPMTMQHGHHHHE